MGSSGSTEVTIDWDLVESYYTTAVESNFLPDVGIDQTFQKFSFANSDMILQQHFSDNLAEANALEKVPQYVQSLGQALGPITKAPNSIGIGAVVIAFILDLLISSQTATDSNVPAMLQRVFNNEKSNRILVTMHGYMKQHRIHIHDTPELIRIAQNTKDTLSDQLIDLQHVMMGTEMRSHHLKHWVNGAAFHVLLLAHIANMKHSEGASCLAVLRAAPGLAIDEYLRELPVLLDKYKQYKLDTIRLRVETVVRCGGLSCGTWKTGRCNMRDSELQKRMYISCPNLYLVSALHEMYVRHREEYITLMCEKQMAGLTTYFTYVKSNLTSLITHHGVFRVPTCREVRRTYHFNCY